MTTASVAPLPNADNVQGNVLAGFMKDYQTFAFFSVSDATKAIVWLEMIADQDISRQSDVGQLNKVFKSLGSRSALLTETVIATLLNVAFTSTGFEALGINVQALGFESAFSDQLDVTAKRIGDTGPSDPTTWATMYKNLHVLFIVASDRSTILDERLNQLLRDATANGLTYLGQEDGEARADRPGHEHFGFRDGVSQPRPRVNEEDGLSTDGTSPWDFVLEPAIIESSSVSNLPIANSAPSGTSTSSAQSQPNVAQAPAPIASTNAQNASWTPAAPAASVPPDPTTAATAGGSASEPVSPSSSDAAGASPIPVAASSTATPIPSSQSSQPLTSGQSAAQLSGSEPPGQSVSFTAEGSYLVFRRLAQDVAGFQDFIEANSPPGMDLGAKLMGRYADGAPLVDAGGNSLPDPGPVARTTNGVANDFDGNDFAFADGSAAVVPFSAHIRKSNPRNGNNVRIMRRGIAFGKSYSPDAADTTPNGRAAKRGLLFACYQASIARQFETIMGNWVNAPDFQASASGVDPFIGGLGSGTCPIAVNGAPGGLIAMPRFVTTEGSAYLFTLSIAALRSMSSFVKSS